MKVLHVGATGLVGRLVLALARLLCPLLDPPPGRSIVEADRLA